MEAVEILLGIDPFVVMKDITGVSRKQARYLSLVERGKVEIGAAVLLAISRHCRRSLEWLLTGSAD